MTAEEHEKLGAELNYLRNERMAEVAEQLKVARSFGDLSENSEYDDAKNEQGKLNSSILEKEDLFKNANIVSVSDRTDIVGFGRRVRVRSTADKSETVYEIVSTTSVNPLERKISEASPLGRALIERKKGDVVEYDAPRGRFSYEIISIE
jgi:transcription elongation factor GreA